MIKRDKNKEAEYLARLAEDVPEFVSYEEFDDLIYIDYDRLGSYIIKLIGSSNKDDLIILKKTFKHLNSLYKIGNDLVLNILEVCIFEVLITNKYGYLVSEKLMSKSMYQYFISKFPLEKNKDSWNTKEYYSEEEYQKILKLLNDKKD
ncbi:MAG: hypothetical protein R2786_02285 [Flavobacteriaceae bacterium]